MKHSCRNESDRTQGAHEGPEVVPPELAPGVPHIQTEVGDDTSEGNSDAENN